MTTQSTAYLTRAHAIGVPAATTSAGTVATTAATTAATAAAVSDGATVAAPTTAVPTIAATTAATAAAVSDGATAAPTSAPTTRGTTVRELRRTAQPDALPCRTADDPDLWFAERTADVERAKAACGPCPLREACLAGARERGEPWGVWGGEVFVDGAIVAVKRGRGRPRKVAAA